MKNRIFSVLMVFVLLAFAGAVFYDTYYLKVPASSKKLPENKPEKAITLPPIELFSINWNLNIEVGPFLDGSGASVIWSEPVHGEQVLLRAPILSLDRPARLLPMVNKEVLISVGRSHNKEWFSVLTLDAGIWWLESWGPDEAHYRTHFKLDSLPHGLEVIKVNHRGESILATQMQEKGDLSFLKVAKNGSLIPLFDNPEPLIPVLIPVMDEDGKLLFRSVIDEKEKRIGATALIGDKWKTILESWSGRLDFDYERISPQFNPRMNSVDFILQSENGTSRLMRLSLKDGSLVTLAGDTDYDIMDFSIDHKTGELDFYITAEPDKKNIHFTKAKDQGRLDSLKSLMPGWRILDIDRNPTKNLWLVSMISDRTPTVVKIIDWQKRLILGSFDVDRNYLPLSDYSSVVLAPTQAVKIPTRDNVLLDGFLTQPQQNRKGGNSSPLILYVHGGPASYDQWGYDGRVQFLANRGYAILQVNYRGSSSRGEEFASFQQAIFNRKAIEDVEDALAWALQSGLINPRKVAIMGDSFGGYLTALALERHPETIACGVSFGGAYDFTKVIDHQQKSSQPVALQIISKQYYGDAHDPEILKKLKELSPSSHPELVKVPFLIGVGEEDDILPPKTSYDFARDLEKSGARIIVATFDNEGHGLSWLGNKAAYFNLVENFLSLCLGGNRLPLDKETILDSDMNILSDNSNLLPGLRSILPADRYHSSMP